MKQKIILLLVLIPAITLNTWGQENKLKFLSLEFGSDIIGCEAPDKEYIRPLNDQSYTYYSNQINSFMTLNHVGLKFEYRVIKNLVGLSTGIRYTRMTSSIGRETSSDPEYFYVDYTQSGLITEYARVLEISQKGDYLGIPLEIRFYPGKERKIKVYYKAGGSFNLKLQSKDDIKFFNNSVEQYQDEVIKVIESASPYYSTIHLGVGLKIGNTNKPGISIETNTPIGVLFSNGSHFINPIGGAGFQLLLRVPLTIKEK